MRLFFAVPVTDGMAENFLKLAEKNEREGVRWIKRENLHLTLLFLGEVKEENLPEAKNIASEVFSQQHPFKVTFEKLEYKGQRKKQGLVWARFHKNGEFKNISKNLFDALKHISPHAHHHPDPIPHVTLARTKGEFSSDEYELDVDVEERELRAEKAELWQTLQGKNGVDYISLEKFKFIQ